MTAGAPTKYKDSYCKIGRGLALLGMSNIEIAKHLLINEATIYTWMNKYPKFNEAIRSGGVIADAEVSESLFDMANGYEYNSEELKVVAMGQGMGSEVQRVDVVKKVEKNANAAIRWLANRQRDKWSQAPTVQIEQMNIQNNSVTNMITVDQSILTMEQLETIKEQYEAQIEENGN